jgi:hypothetical protein
MTKQAWIGLIMCIVVQGTCIPNWCKLRASLDSHTGVHTGSAGVHTGSDSWSFSQTKWCDCIQSQLGITLQPSGSSVTSAIEEMMCFGESGCHACAFSMNVMIAHTTGNGKRMKSLQGKMQLVTVSTWIQVTVALVTNTTAKV